MRGLLAHAGVTSIVVAAGGDLDDPRAVGIHRARIGRAAMTGESHGDARSRHLYPAAVSARVFFTHTRPEPLLGMLTPLHTPDTVGLGSANQGGTLSVPGMLFVNRATWAHGVDAVATLLRIPRKDLLEREEIEALDHLAAPGDGTIDEPSRSSRAP